MSHHEQLEEGDAKSIWTFPSWGMASTLKSAGSTREVVYGCNSIALLTTNMFTTEMQHYQSLLFEESFRKIVDCCNQCMLILLK